MNEAAFASCHRIKVIVHAIYKKYKDNQNSKKYQENFFKYNPNSANKINKSESNNSELVESPKRFSASITMNSQDTSKKSSLELKGDDEEKATTQSIEDTFKSSPEEKNEEKNEKKFPEKKNQFNHINNKKYSHKTPYKNFNKPNKKTGGKTKKLFSFSKIGKYLWK